MSRLSPTLYLFENIGKSDIKISHHSNLDLFSVKDINHLTIETLRSFKSTMKQVINDLTSEMLDMNFYFYDTREFEDMWIRVYEHLNLDVAVVIDVRYMFSEDSRVLSYPVGMKLYQNDSGEMLVDKFKFGTSCEKSEVTEEDIKVFNELVHNGSKEMINMITRRVYAL